MNKKTGCREGNCQVLFDSSIRCEYRKCGKLHVCLYMHQGDGRCLHKEASIRPKPARGGSRNGNTNNSFFRRQNDAWCSEYRHNKESLTEETVLVSPDDF